MTKKLELSDDKKKQLVALSNLARLINDGKAGVDTNGKLVSLKDNPNAVPIPKHE